MAQFKIESTLRIAPEQVQPVQSVFKHLAVTLRPNDNIATWAGDNVNAWSMIQRSRSRLKAGDRVTLISHDGSVMHDQYIVSQADSGSVYLTGKPLRIVELTDAREFREGDMEVVRSGAGWRLRNRKARGGRDTGTYYDDFDAARRACLAHQQSRVA